MSAPGKWSLAWHTIRYLKCGQIAHQVLHRLAPRRFVTESSDAGPFTQVPLLPFPKRPPSYLGRATFRFLNQDVSLGEPLDWSASSQPKLWQYNLHYFDFLLQENLSFAQGEKLIHSWITGHLPQLSAVGWEPYPLSLRVVNWLKFHCRHQRAPSPETVRSLALQGANLERSLERHILGNHLFENAKALSFLGRFFSHHRWDELGGGLLAAQIPEQFLSDGGHFELSPMYHSIMLEGLLDLINLQAAAAGSEVPRLRTIAGKALGWLNSIVDQNDQIPLLNDSAHGICLPAASLRAYASQLGVEPDQTGELRQFGSWSARNLSGYWVASQDRFRLWFDTALLGPDYLPGHAHGDMLSILLDFDGRKIFEDTGVFEYLEGERRSYSRSLHAHNTVSVDALDQAQFWKSFRVGKRAHPQNLVIAADSIACSHDGFLNQGGKVIHTRTLKFLPHGFEVHDQLAGSGSHSFAGRFHCAPDVDILPAASGAFLLNGSLLLEPLNCSLSLVNSDFFPEYGRIIKRPCFLLRGDFDTQTQFGIRCTFSS